MISYTESLDGITPEKLRGFFVGWPNPPSSAKHLEILRAAYKIWLAVDTETDNVVGFINAIGDGVLSAFIPLLEVLPEYQGEGIGSELARRMLDSLRHLYAVDLICDANVQPFYVRLGMQPYTGMVFRNYDRQSAE
ncbi:MAG: GNAT family N-acetyltransferase [Burkholderiales bacterium]|nr:GNAT family N-acetyltransferase [Anaerolineae bacterium]